MIYGMLNSEKIWHKNLTDVSISTVRCSYFTLGNPKSHFQQYYSYILVIIYVINVKKLNSLNMVLEAKSHV